LLARGSRASDLAVVEGHFEPDNRQPQGGSLDTLCSWLDLPRLAIVNAQALRGCQLPDRPQGLDGILLDAVCGERDACRLQTLFEALWNVPVLGWLGTLCAARTAISSIPRGGRASVELCHALGKELSRHLDVDRIVKLAGLRPLDASQPPCEFQLEATAPLRVALACDNALGGYFPDTLDLLEALGAEVSDFSPLRDDRLPPATDVVYLGCGHPESFAAELGENDCMMLSLKSHLCSGRRIYAEGGGLAYLCQQIEMPDGERWPMVGALPLTAHFHETTAAPNPAELTLVADTWLGPSPLSCKGYLNPQWKISPSGAADGCVAETGHELDVVHRHQAVGSRMYLDFAACHEMLGRFFQPHAPCREAADAASRLA
jgi:cobyrinic acid a,c-diamide synthase